MDCFALGLDTFKGVLDTDNALYAASATVLRECSGLRPEAGVTMTTC